VALYSGLKRPVREADHSPSGAEINCGPVGIAITFICKY
jgi:hypothetical protein